MNPERWQQVRAILAQAIAVSADKRSCFVEQACGGDPELLQEVFSLLESHDNAGSEFLNSPAVDLRSTVPAIPAATRVGLRIGAYQIMEEIAKGGMGEVYRAVRADGEYKKQVAIKVVRFGFDTPDLVERFRHERQILATLEHPNIAQALDAGTTEDGMPYLVMELIEGTAIDRYCDQNNLDLLERLHLFRRVCLAVQYAHQRLVIHRDIKPNNILVTAEGIPKLLDFGIAKIFDPAGGVEATELRPMTPEYASPEQLRGDPITTASDVYALGVVLYKLLTGRSPYSTETRSPIEFAKAICDLEPAHPSSDVSSSPRWRRALKGDLDDITLKALRKEPERRYASAEQLAEDIRRHLQSLPVIASKDSRSYRLGKFVRRHKAGVAASALVATALAGGLAATLREARIAVQERSRAERRFNDVRKLANSFLFEFDGAIKDLPGSTPARALVVKRALEYLDGLAAEARTDRSLQLEIASAYQKVGAVQGDPMFPNLGDSKGALESFTKALAMLESLLKTESNNQQVRLALASTHQQISDVLSFSGDMEGAVKHSGNALEMYEALAGSLATDAKFQTQRVTETYHYANLLQLSGHLDQAAEAYTRSVQLSQTILATNGSDQEGQVHLATSFDGLGNVLQEKGDTAGALENRRKGLAIRQELVAHDPNNAHYRRQLAFSHHNVGLSLVEAGDLNSALVNFRRELTLFESLSAADPHDVQARRNRSLAHKQIGDVLIRMADVRAALAAYRAALDIDRDLSSRDPGNSQAMLDLSFSETKVGSALGKLGQTPEALTLLRSGIAKQESLLARDPHHILLYNHLANSYTQLADCLRANERVTDAVAYYRKALAARITLSEKSPNSSTNRGALAECYINLAQALAPSDIEEAARQDNNALQVLQGLTTTDRSNVRYQIAQAEALSNLARLHVRMAGHDNQRARRAQNLTQARSLYESSQKLWMELNSNKKLPLTRRQDLREVGEELARCADSLAKLQ